MPKDKDEERSACSNFGLRVRAVLILAGLTVLGHVQQENDRAIGETMVYQTMLDEIDEGTAIFKCTNNPPSENRGFLVSTDCPALTTSGSLARAGASFAAEWSRVKLCQPVDSQRHWLYCRRFDVLRSFFCFVVDLFPLR